MNDPSKPEAHPFTNGLIAFAWISIGLLGPIALFLTWYGDCFSTMCPVMTTADRLLYGVDILAWIALGVIGFAAVARPHGATYIALGMLGLFLAGQSLAGLLGVRGLLGFGIIAPAAALLVLASVLGGIGLTRQARPPRRSATSAFTWGCGIYFVGYFGIFGVASAASGQISGLLLAILLFVLVGVVLVTFRRIPTHGDPPRAE
jgi:hypothetical protein